MADLEKMIPHILLWEVGKTKEEREGKVWESLTPGQIYDRVMSRGYHVVAGDKGGPTMCGVTLNAFKDWCKRLGKIVPGVNDLQALQYDEWLALLKQMFWDPCKGDAIRNQSIAEMLVDWRWVNGTQAVRDAQTVLSCVADGIVGPKTLGALNASDSLSVFTRLKNARLRAYERIVGRSPSQKRFYNGWVNRTNSITFRP